MSFNYTDIENEALIVELQFESAALGFHDALRDEDEATTEKRQLHLMKVRIELLRRLGCEVPSDEELARLGFIDDPPTMPGHPSHYANQRVETAVQDRGEEDGS